MDRKKLRAPRRWPRRCAIDATPRDGLGWAETSPSCSLVACHISTTCPDSGRPPSLFRVFGHNTPKESSSWALGQSVAPGMAKCGPFQANDSFALFGLERIPGRRGGQQDAPVGPLQFALGLLGSEERAGHWTWWLSGYEAAQAFLAGFTKDLDFTKCECTPAKCFRPPYTRPKLLGAPFCPPDFSRVSLVLLRFLSPLVPNQLPRASDATGQSPPLRPGACTPVMPWGEEWRKG